MAINNNCWLAAYRNFFLAHWSEPTGANSNLFSARTRGLFDFHGILEIYGASSPSDFPKFVNVSRVRIKPEATSSFYDNNTPPIDIMCRTRQILGFLALILLPLVHTDEHNHIVSTRYFIPMFLDFILHPHQTFYTSYKFAIFHSRLFFLTIIHYTFLFLDTFQVSKMRTTATQLSAFCCRQNTVAFLLFLFEQHCVFCFGAYKKLFIYLVRR